MEPRQLVRSWVEAFNRGDADAVENLFQEGEWAILEWRDPLGRLGCGIFHVGGGEITFQRGYWDKLSFLRAQGLALDDES